MKTSYQFALPFIAMALLVGSCQLNEPHYKRGIEVLHQEGYISEKVAAQLLEKVEKEEIHARKSFFIALDSAWQLEMGMLYMLMKSYKPDHIELLIDPDIMVIGVEEKKPQQELIGILTQNRLVDPKTIDAFNHKYPDYPYYLYFPKLVDYIIHEQE